MVNLLLLLASVWPADALATSLCVAHRGNHGTETGQFLENSLSAIISAHEIGAPAVEFDIRHTQDGIAISMHDASLERTSQNKKDKSCPLGEQISDLSFQNITDNCELVTGEAIPAVKQVLEYLHDKDVIVLAEFKDMPSDQTLSMFHEFYEEHPDRLRFISFKTQILDRVREFGLEQYDRYHLSSKTVNVKTDYEGINVKKPSEDYVKKMLRSDLFIGVWTIDSESQMEDYMKWDVHAITTNHPQQCLELQKKLF